MKNLLKIKIILKKKLIFYILIIIIFKVSIFAEINYSMRFRKLADYNKIDQIYKIYAEYKIIKDNLFSIEKINYYINHNSFSNYIVIDEVAEGEFCTSRYTVVINRDLFPVFVELKYYSTYEGLSYHVKYTYKENKLFYYYNGEERVINNKKFYVDSLFLFEVLTFIKLENIKKFESVGYLVPKLIQIPFVFNFLNENTIFINNRYYDSLIYSGEINSIFKDLINLFYGSSRLWLLKDFPHIRLKANFGGKIFQLLYFKIYYK